MPDRRIDALRRTWEELGRRDALWAIVTVPTKRGNKWLLGEFMATGAEAVNKVMEYAYSLGVPFAQGKALDFGCGVGRLTQALALHFSSVVGVDISEPMLEQARQYNRHPERCHYVLNTRDDLACFSDGCFDFVYSEITLQHIPATLAARYITELVRVTARSGLIVFGVVEPSWRWEARAVVRRLTPEPLVRVARWVAHAGKPEPILYGIGRARVVGAVQAGGGRIIDAVAPTDSGGWSYVRYSVTKRSLEQ